MKNNRIIVMGASTGGFEAFKTIISALPADFEVPIFIVWHISPEVKGVLPHVLNRVNNIYAANVFSEEKITVKRIYVARPDHHLLISDSTVQTSHGPKENRFRPAIDPLFRSAAYSYDRNVIGVILSGGLDDGTAGLWTIKKYGGIAIVQNPLEAEVSSMPENAIAKVDVDYTVSVSEIADLLVKLTNEPPPENSVVMKDEQTKKEIEIAASGNALKKGVFAMGELTPYTCPECNGVLSRLRDDNIIRFRCHTGHAYSIDSLMVSLSEKIEDSLYNAIRRIDESVMLLNHIGDHCAEENKPKLAAMYFKKAKEAEERSKCVRNITLNREISDTAVVEVEAGKSDLSE